MSDIDFLYQRSVSAMTAREKIAKAIELFNWSREFIGREIRKSHPNASDERLKLLVALRMYGTDEKTRELIEDLLVNVPD